MTDIDETGYVDIDLHFDANSSPQTIITDPLQLFMQEIEIAVKTGPGEIWGVGTSINLKRYLFNAYITMSQIRNEITAYLGKYCAHAKIFNYVVTAEILTIENKELIYIKVAINTTTPGDETSEIVTKFLLGV